MRLDAAALWAEYAPWEYWNQRGMNRIAISQFRRAGVDAPPEAAPWTRRWWGRILLLLLGVGMLTAAFAPVNQFELAWVGLVPWLVVIAGTRSQWSAFFWGWVGGLLFFIANMWWIAFVTAWGMVGLMALLGLYWGLAGVVIRGCGLLGAVPHVDHEVGADEPAAAVRTSVLRSPLLRIVLIAAVWVCTAEWLRGTWPWHGLPWLYLGHTQSPALWVCQIADITGVAGISFLIVMANAWLAMWVLNRLCVRGLVGSGVVVVTVIIAALAYGVVRMRTEVLTPGPTVAVIQPNYPQDNSGQKGATAVEMLRFHLDQMRDVLEGRSRRGQAAVDLFVWSETMMPPLDSAALEQYRPGEDNWVQYAVGLSQQVIELVGKLAQRYDVAVLSGGEYWADFHRTSGGAIEPAIKRNASYFFRRDGELSPLRYDKIHLVPFGEFIPFKYGFPPLYRLMVKLGPPDMEYYSLESGAENGLTVFDLHRAGADGNPFGPGKPWRLVTPICFEDIDADLCARMFRPTPQDPTHKRADVLVNLTNDGWFLANENAQHLQAGLFRSIENRVPTARSVNTGISGFIDPLGRPHDLLAVRTAGTSVGTVLLCDRVTFFTRYGAVFSLACVGVTVVAALLALMGWVLGHGRRAGGSVESETD